MCGRRQIYGREKRSRKCGVLRNAAVTHSHLPSRAPYHPGKFAVRPDFYARAFRHEKTNLVTLMEGKFTVFWAAGAPTIFTAAAVFSAFLIVILRPLLGRYAPAQPNARSSHKTPTPQGGGIAVIATTIAVSGIAYMSHRSARQARCSFRSFLGRSF